MDYNKSYHESVALLFYEVCKSKYKFEKKIAKLKKLAMHKSLYVGSDLTVSNKLTDIEIDLERFDNAVRKSSDCVNFRGTAEVLEEFKLRLYECESLLFKALRSNVACCFCKNVAPDNDTDDDD